MRATDSLTTVVDGAVADRRRSTRRDPCRDSRWTPPSTRRSATTGPRLPENRRELIERYRFVDVALKVVGVGSVGTRCFIVLLEGRDEGDPLILQAKEATGVGPRGARRGEPLRQPRRAGRRRPATHADDARHLPRLDPRSARSRLLLPPAVGHEGVRRHHGASACWGSGSTPPCAPARLPVPMPAAATAWRSPRTWERATRSTLPIADFSEAYADQNERDHAAFNAAIADGRLAAAAG